MGNFGSKINRFIESFIYDDGYKEVIKGLGNTLKIAILGLLIGIVIGTIIASVRVMPKYKLLPRILDKICALYVGFFRGTPIVVQLLVGYFVILPLIGLGRISSENVCVVIFGLNSGAYVSEVMRGGINSVDVGQMEAGRALGLSYPTTMMKFVVPQAIKNILPSLGNEFISLIKETSVISFVGAADLYVALNKIGQNNYEPMVPFLFMAICYIILIFLITQLIRILEKVLSKSDRNGGKKNEKKA
ncbi:MAG: amino acid ABC transporter permease [Clostridia bacterium]|nr:amino acid ABC transporter permease [Clostridia bacterium]